MNTDIWQPVCSKKIITDLDILYCRLSRDDGDGEESNSISNQKSILAAFAEENGFDHPVFVVDDGYTGTNFQRPGWQAVHNQIELNNIRSIICKNKDRFGRDYLRVGLYMEMFKEKGIRFIAIGDNVDNIREDDDLAPFRDLISEQYAKDSSKKILAVMRSKGMSGKHLTTKTIYGYRKDPDDHNHWLVDEPAAAVVRRIFQMTLDGNGPFIIAKTLTDEKVIRPSCHIARMTGTVTDKTEDKIYQWTGTSIKTIIGRLEYTGCVVNFRTYKTSFKTKKYKLNPPEKWEIFEDKHEAIIDKETWETAQKCRKAKRKRNKRGETNPLTGLVYCATCGSRMYNHKGKYADTRPSSDSYCCPKYNKYPSECTMHYISVKNLRELILNSIRRVSCYVRKYESEFIEKLRETAEIKKGEQVKEQRKQLASDKRRIAELDRFIQQTYEDKVNGTLSEKRFVMLSAQYEAEQETLEARITETEHSLAEYAEDTVRADKFIAIVRKYTDFEELTPAMLNEYIDKIVIHEAERPRGQRNQQVDIYLSFIGQFTPPDINEEEMEAITPEERRKAQQREHYYANREKILADKAKQRAEEKAARLAAKPDKTPEQISAEKAAKKERRLAYQREYQREWQRKKREEAAAKEQGDIQKSA